MKKLLKILLPPFVGFAIFFLIVRYSSLYFTLRIDEMGGGDLVSFMAFYRYTLPLLFAVAALTQLLIAVPIWNSLLNTPDAIKINAIIDTGFVCLLFAIGISYPMSYPVNNPDHFIKLTGFMTFVQLFYWGINLFILHLLE